MSGKRALALCLAAVLALASAGCAKSAEVWNDIKYGESVNYEIEDLGEDAHWALVDIGEENDVLLVSDMPYDDGHGNMVSAFCDVYYSIDGETYHLGSIESLSTAYPVSYGEKCLYTASNNCFETYVIDSTAHELVLKTQYKSAGNVWYCVENGTETEISEKEFWESFKIYAKGTVVQFDNGLSDRS